MVAFSDIQKFSQALVREFQPRRVVLFGSHAAGRARDDSDVDILVTMDYEGNSLRAAADIIRKLRPRFAVDLIVRTEQEVQELLKQNDWFLADATTGGRLLYEASD